MWLVKWSAVDQKDNFQLSSGKLKWWNLGRTFPFTCVSTIFSLLSPPSLTCADANKKSSSFKALMLDTANVGGVKLEMCSLLCSQPIVTCNPFLFSLHLCVCPLVSSSPSFLCCQLPGQNLTHPLAIFKKKQTSELWNHSGKCLTRGFVIVLWKTNFLNLQSLCYQVG